MKRGGYIQRKTPMPRATKPMARKPMPQVSKKKSRYAKRKRDYDFMGFVRRLPCAVAMESLTWRWCSRRWRSEAHHAGEHALGRKPHDRTCINLCPGCHHAIHSGANGSYFEGWSKDRRQEWMDDKQADAQSMYLSDEGKL